MPFFSSYDYLHSYLHTVTLMEVMASLTKACSSTTVSEAQSQMHLPEKLKCLTGIASILWKPRYLDKFYSNVHLPDRQKLILAKPETKFDKMFKHPSNFSTRRYQHKHQR